MDAKETEENKRQLVPYVPGDYTDPAHRHDSYDLLDSKRHEEKEFDPSRGFPTIKEDFTRKEPRPVDLKAEADKMYKLNKKTKSGSYSNDRTHSKKGTRSESPVRGACANFELAKKLAKENLEHQPLPDTVTDALYRKLQMQVTVDPGMALDENYFASGVGWKEGYGPTRCTKLKVFRPKTAVHKRTDNENDIPISSFEKKWRFIRRQKVAPIELALCWDLTPVNPEDEPKRTPHIDGSNGSLAPAVFSMVHSPKEEQTDKCDGLQGCDALFEKKQYQEVPDTLRRPRTAFLGNSRSGQGNTSQNRAQSAFNLHDSYSIKNKNIPDIDSFHTLTSTQWSKYCSKDCYRQRINKLPNSRICVACELKNVKLKDSRPKSEYKMAFKAGVPQSKSVSSIDTLLNAKRNLKIPKPKNPYRQRNYAINSLASPFTLQKDKRRDYPEHWRLATVYQHSYKPVSAQKRSLLANVFK